MQHVVVVIVQLLGHVQLCNPMNCSKPGFPVLHYFPEFSEIHVHWVSDTIQPSQHLLPPSPLPLILSQHQVFTHELLLHIRWPKYWSSASASIFSVNIQDWFPLGLTGSISLLSKGLSRVFSNTTVQKHQLFSAQPSLWSNSHIYTWLLEKPELWLMKHIHFKILELKSWRRRWHPTPVLLPGKSHGWRSLVGCSPWGC